MNVVREIERLNERELKYGITDGGSWHQQYANSAYVFVGGLHPNMTSPLLITIMSQFGEVVDAHIPITTTQPPVNRGFGFIAYHDQRSTVLAVDNMNGVTMDGRVLRVDHADKYRRPKHITNESTGAEFIDIGEGEDEYDRRRQEIWDEDKYQPITSNGHTALADSSNGTVAAGMNSTHLLSLDLSQSADPNLQRIAAIMLERRRILTEAATNETAAEKKTVPLATAAVAPIETMRTDTVRSDGVGSDERRRRRRSRTPDYHRRNRDRSCSRSVTPPPKRRRSRERSSDSERPSERHHRHHRSHRTHSRSIRNDHRRSDDDDTRRRTR